MGESFPADVYVWKDGSPNVKFVDCNGIDINANSPTQPSIFPNPTRDVLNIETHSLNQYSIEIISLNGQMIYNTAKEGTSFQIDFSSFQKGAYFITISSKDFVITRKIMKL